MLNFPERLKTVSIGDDHMIIQTRFLFHICINSFSLVSFLSIELEDFSVWVPTLGGRLVTVQTD